MTILNESNEPNTDEASYTEKPGGSYPTELPIVELYESPTNPRRILDTKADGELEQSIAQHGVLQSLLVRYKPNETARFEVVLGSRRLRCAGNVGLAHLPVDVREMTDEQVVEAQMVENLQRQDVHPLDEADGYQKLLDRGRDVANVAAAVGKDTNYIYRRLKLCALGKEGRKAFLEGHVSPGVALVLARIPNPKLQAKATAELLKHGRYNDGVVELLSVTEASRIVQRGYMLRLADATFDVADGELVPAAGSCTACPKRTGSNPQLFDEIDDREDLCTDSTCHADKCDAAWEKRSAEAKAAGIKVLSKKEAKEAFPHGGDYLQSSEYLKLSDICRDDLKGRSYRTLLGKDAATAVAQTPNGQVIELIEKAGLKKKLRDAGHAFAAGGTSDSGGKGKAGKASKGSSSSSSKASGSTGPSQETKDADELALARTISALVERFENAKLNRELWLLLVGWSVDIVNAGVLERRNLAYGTVHKAAEKMTEPQLKGLLFEMLMPEPYALDVPQLQAACKTFGVDAKAIRAEALKEVKGVVAANAELAASMIKAGKAGAMIKAGKAGATGKADGKAKPAKAVKPAKKKGKAK